MKRIVLFGLLGLFFIGFVLSSPLIDVVSPSNGSTVTTNYAYVNFTVNDSSGLNVSSWFNWNNSLAGYWSMDYYNGTGIYDNSSNGLFGTFEGDLSSNNISLGSRGNSTIFENSEGYINISDGSPLNISSNFTFSVWVNLNNSDQLETILEKDGYRVGISGGNVPYFEVISNNTLTNWVNTGDVSGSNVGYTLNVYNGTLYVGTGQTGGIGGQVFSYNDSGDSWSQIGDLSSVGFNGAVTALTVFEDRLYVANYSADVVFAYNFSTGNWTNAGNFSSTSGQRMLLVYNNDLYSTDRTDDPILSVYNSSNNSWTDLVTFGGYNGVNALTSYNGSMYIGLGKTGGGAAVFSYNGSGSVANIVGGNISSVIQPRSLGRYGDKLYMVTNGVTQGDLYFYNSSNDSWYVSGPSDASQTMYSSITYFGDLYTVRRFNLYKYNVSGGSWITYSSVISDPTTLSMARYKGKVYASTGQANGNVYVMGNGSGVFSNTSLSRNQWYHLAGTFNGSVLQFYLDGVLVGSQSFQGEVLGDSNSFIIGRGKGTSLISYSVSSDEYFSGLIDEVLIFNRSLSSSEIQSLYNNTDSTLGNNFTSLDDGSYSYSVYSINSNGDTNISNYNFVIDTSVSSSSSGPSASTPPTSGGIPSNYVYKISQDQLLEGYSRLLKKGNKVSVSGQNLNYVVEVINVGDNVIISVSDKEYSLDLEGSEKIDANEDGYYDLEVRVSEIRSNGYANLVFTEIYEEIHSEQRDSSSDELKTSDEDFDANNNTWIYVLVIVVLVLVIVYFSESNRLKLWFSRR